MTTSGQMFSAAQIAFSIGRPKHYVLKFLKSVLPSGEILVSGNLASAWTIPTLPSGLKLELQAVVERKGFRNIEHLLTSPVEVWHPPIPFAEIDSPYQVKAARLRDALAGSLAKKDNTDTSRAEFDQQGADDYARCFGYTISTRHWRRIFDRTIERDRGMEQWTRLELYLDENVCVKRESAPLKPKVRFDHSELRNQIDGLENKVEPTFDDRAFLLDAAFRHLESFYVGTQDPQKQRAFKKSVINYLFSTVPGLSKTLKSLRRLFNDNYAEWTKNGKTLDAIRDMRGIKSGNFRKPDFKEDEEKIRNKAIVLGGNETLAYRELRKEGQLSQTFVDYYSFNPRSNKSYLPSTVRNKITSEVEMCGPLHRGPWEAKMRGPYIQREWSDVQPGDWFSGDDVTWNNYYYFYDETGLHIDRGECLVLCDLRTGYLLDYILIAGKYNSSHIRSLILKVHDRFGLPHKGFYFENGVWKSKLIEGVSPKDPTFHLRETERGLLDCGLQVKHATTPRAKTIEGLFHILQDAQRDQPGFIGFNERTEKMERMQDLLSKIKSGKVKPEKVLLSMEQWSDTINELLRRFNADPQNGKMLNGKSPAEMWAEGMNRKPLRKLPEDARYLLSTHKKRVKVRQEGIILDIGGVRRLYCNEHTGHLIGREVLAFYNIDFPESLTVSDLNRQNYFTVKSHILPAMSATKEQLHEVHTDIQGHRRAAKAIYGNIPDPVISTITRDNEQPKESLELGRFHNEQEKLVKAEQTIKTRKLRELQTNCVSRGIPIPQWVKNPDRVLEGIRREQEIRERIARKQISTKENNE